MNPLRLAEFPRPAEGSAVCIGVFDGVHRGHQALARAVRQAAEPAGLRPLALSFDPHPAAFFRGDEVGQLITLPTHRAELLGSLGLGAVFASFDAEFAAMTPQQFVDLLDQKLAARVVVVGIDFRFGAGRAGDVETLRQLAAGRFGVQVLDEVSEEGLHLRSSNLRRAIRGGDMAQAKRLTGRVFSFEGRVVHGQGRGAGLGFPTANLCVDPRQILPASGVYALRARVGGRWSDGVMNIGLAPTLRCEDGPIIPEVHLLEWGGDLYGQRMAVSVVARLRDEQRFDDLSALTGQIARDCDAARRALRP